MPEYFEMSFLFENNEKYIEDIKNKFNVKFGVQSGENYIDKSTFSFLRKQSVHLEVYSLEDMDFCQLILSFASWVFHEEQFDKELESIVEFVDDCFGMSDVILYVLCCYELSTYFLRDINLLEDIDEGVVLSFPIAFVKNGIGINLKPIKKMKHSRLFVNRQAQDLFSIM